MAAPLAALAGGKERRIAESLRLALNRSNAAIGVDMGNPEGDRQSVVLFVQGEDGVYRTADYNSGKWPRLKRTRYIGAEYPGKRGFRKRGSDV